MSKKVILTIGDTHFEDKNYGRHKDYENDCKVMMERVATAVEEYAKTLDDKIYRIVMLGDFADCRFTHLEFRVCVENFLTRLRAVSEKVYCLKGNHDTVGGSMTELDYYLSRGMIDAHPTEENIGGKLVRFVDFIRDEEECAQAHEGDAEVIFSHNALAAGDNTLFSSVNVAQLDAPKLKVCVMGHIHGEMYFKSTNRHGQDISILDGGAACVRSATRKDVEGFHLLTLHFDEATGKLGSKKVPVKYVEDAFVEVDDKDANGKWSVADSEKPNIDFGIKGVGSMDINDLAKQLDKNSTPEVASTVRMLFEKYGGVSMNNEEISEADEDDDNFLDEITSLFKTKTVATVVPTVAENVDVLADDTADDLDALAEDTTEETESDELDALMEEDLADEDVASIEDLLSEEEKKALKSGVVDEIDLDGNKVVYVDGQFTFTE